MKTCPHCNSNLRGDKKQLERPNFLYKWLGIHTFCEECNKTHFEPWDNRSVAVIVLSILLFQFTISLIVYPALNYFIASEVLKITVFTLFHLVSLPMYLMTSVSLMLNSQ